MSATVALHGVLDALERSHHSAAEARVLLELVERRDASIPELGQVLGVCPSDIRPAARRLDRRGLIRSRHDPSSEQAFLEITPAGRSTMRALLTAAGQAAPA